MNFGIDNAELRQSLDHFDRDHNRSIEFGESCELPDTLDSDMNEQTPRIGFELIDANDNSMIDVEEFAGRWLPQG